MRLTVTPIGSARMSAGQIASAVVEYLAGIEADNAPALTEPPKPAGDDHTVAYFADSVEGPGRWLGRGATHLALDGQVERQAFKWVLEGRDPATGERLLSSQGSADRDHLAVGQATRRGADGEWLYDLHDAAKALGLSPDEVDVLVAAGDARSTNPTAPVAWLEAERDASGERWIRDDELDRFADRANRVSPAAVMAGGAPDDTLSVAQVARLLGVSSRYVRGCCRYWETHRDQIGELDDAGLRPRRAWMRSSRDTERPGRPFVIRRDEVAAFAARRARPVVRVGYDLTLSTEKSIAVVALLDQGGRSGQVLAAIDAANDTALGYLEEHAAVGRRQGQRVGTEGLVVASFLHGTSRALDPFPHRHNVVANAVVDEHGERRALDARALYRHAPAAAALATAELRCRLSTDLGVRWRRSARGSWEIDGVPDATIAEFSTRRDEVDAALVELSEALGRPVAPGEVDRVVLATRAAKARVAVEDLRSGWWRRAGATGFDRRALRGCFGRASPEPLHELAADDEVALHEWLASQLVERSATFSHGDVIVALASWTDDDGQLRLVTPAEMLRQAARFLSSEAVVELRGRGQREGDRLRRRDGRIVDNQVGEPVFTTVALLELERSIFDAFAAGSDAGIAVVDVDRLEEVRGFDGLSDSQRRFASRLCGSGMQIQCAIGHPGSGKTHTLGVAAQAWTPAGLTVVGAAVKGEAARHLAEATGLRTETVAWWLTALDNGHARWTPTTVVVVDEASTLSTGDLARLVEHAVSSGAALRLVGDPAQHGAVGAGGMFDALAQRHRGGPPELDENRRQTGAVDRYVADAVRQGHIAQALAALKKAGQLTEVDRAEGVYVAMITRWLAARRDGNEHPMIDRRNHTRRILNLLAHRALQAEGGVAPSGYTSGDGREFCVGDDIIARRPNRTLHPEGQRDRYIRNGSRGRVIAIDSSDDARPVLVVDFADLGTIRVPSGFVDAHPDRNGRVDVGIDYGYALTSYAIQGSTLPVSSSAITAGGRRSELYVNVTRGRRDNHVFVAAPADPAGGEGHLPRPPDTDVIADVIAAVGRPDQQRCATDIDPTALAAATARRGRSLADLAATADETEASKAADAAIYRRAETLVRHAVARRSVAEPPPSMMTVLPPRPTAPWMAAKWDRAIAAAATYNERWNTQLVPGGWGPALGRPDTTDPTRQQERAAATDAFIDLWAEVVTRQIAKKAQENVDRVSAQLHADPPAWLRAHVRVVIGDGPLTDPARIARLAALHCDVARYRARPDAAVGSDGARGTDTSLLGEQPSPSDERFAEWMELRNRSARLVRGPQVEASGRQR